MTTQQLANTLREVILDVYQTNGQANFWPNHFVDIVEGASMDQVVRAMQLLVEQAVLRPARIEVLCGEGHVFWEGLAADLPPEALEWCQYCEGPPAGGVSVDLTYRLEDRWMQRLKRRPKAACG